MIDKKPLICIMNTCNVPSTNDKIVRVMAGLVSLIGLAVGYFGPDWGYLLVVFAALNVIQSAFTGFCPPEIAYRWMKET